MLRGHDYLYKGALRQYNSIMGLHSRAFCIPTSNSTQTVNIRLLEPNLRADNLTLTTWTSSYILAKHLHHIDIDQEALSQACRSTSQKIPVLELGAGTGLVGITAAVLWQTHAVLTDLAPIVPGLAGNIAANKELLASTGGIASCGTLDWMSPHTLHVNKDAGEPLNSISSKATIILAADTVYDEAHPELLSTAILTWLARRPDARALICYPLRVAYLDQIRELWTSLEKGGLEAAEEGKEEAGKDDWDDELLCEWSVWKWKDLKSEL